MEPRDIYQIHLDHVSRALWDRDWEESVGYWTYPHVMKTVDGVGTVYGAEEMIVYSKAFRERMAGLGATAYHRVCVSAQYDPADNDRILGRHRTYILRGGNYLVPPYDCDMILHRAPGIWMSAGISVSISLETLDQTTLSLATRPGLSKTATG
ncbi:MAG: hypothetical protein WBA67_01435 [Jannaschia sp.]